MRGRISCYPNSLAPGRPRRRRAPQSPEWNDSTLISKGFEHIVRETKLGGMGFQGPMHGWRQPPPPAYGAPRTAPDHRVAPTMPPDITQPRGRKARPARDAQYAADVLRMQRGPPASGGGGAGAGAGALRSRSAGHQRGMRAPAGSPPPAASPAEDKGRRVEKQTEEELADEWVAQRPWVVEMRVWQRKRELAEAVAVQALERGRQERKKCAEFTARLRARRASRLEEEAKTRARRRWRSNLAHVPDHIKEAFKLWDTDGGGELDGEELQSALAALGIEADCEKTQRVMKRYDTDHNGSLDLAEFSNMVIELEHAASDVVSAADMRWSPDHVRNALARKKSSLQAAPAPAYKGTSSFICPRE